MTKRLYRIREGKMLGGVCVGLGEYFEIDPVLARIAFVVLAFMHGVGVIAYLALWIIVPRRPLPLPGAANPIEIPIDNSDISVSPVAARHTGRMGQVAGILLIGLGVLFLLDNFIPAIDMDDLWPLLLIGVGAALLWRPGQRCCEGGEVAS
jgi:phage shock protein C